MQNQTLKTLKAYIHSMTKDREPAGWAADKNTAPFVSEDAPILLKIAISPRKSILVPFRVGISSKGGNGELIIHLDIQNQITDAKDSSRKQQP